MLADVLPPKTRKVIYSVLGTVNGILAIPNLIDAPAAAKITGVIGALGFGLAAGNVHTRWFEQ